MNKIICDICGTSFPASADNCPICGTSKEYSVEIEEDISSGMPEYIPENGNRGKFSASSKMVPLEFYNEDAPESDTPRDVLPEERFAPAVTVYSRPNMVLVVILTILIGVFLLGTGYLYLRYQLPNRLPQAVLEHKTEHVSTHTEETEETTEPTVPCQSIVLMSGVPEINRIGQFWLLHVTVTPENTTDELMFTSSDESIVTVTEEGRLCAVAEGEATVLISCGKEQISCVVTVRIPDETEPSETEPAESLPPEAVEDQTEPEATEPVSETTLPQETEPTTQPTQTTELEDVTLKLVQEDISFTKKGVTYQLELDCDLDLSEVTWMTLDPKVAICRDGLITVVGNGTTRIYASYGDQEVYCIVRVTIK